MPGLQEFGFVTYTPGLFTGVGLTCVNVPDESFLDYTIENGKAVLKVLEWTRKLLP